MEYRLSQVMQCRLLTNDASGPSNYRTPYAPYGGFINGYEGNLRAHMMSRNPNFAEQLSTGPASTAQGLIPQEQQQKQQQPPPPPPPQQQQPQQSETTTATQVPKPKPPPPTKSFKVGLPAAVHLSLQSTKLALQVPAKISPVPLPPHVVAAMAKTSPHAQNTGAESRGTAAANLTTSGSWQPQPATESSVPRPAHMDSGAFSSSHMASVSAECQSYHAQGSRPQAIPERPISQPMQEFADVPGSESMLFMDRMMQNLRRVSMNGDRSSNRAAPTDLYQ